MADFRGTILTVKGRNLLAKAQTGATLTFTKIKLGDGLWSTDTDPTQLNDLVSPKLNLPIQDIKVVGDGTVRLRFVLTNTGLSQGFFMREIGIYAQDPDLGEILYAVAYAGDRADFIPSDGVTKVENVVDIYTVIANAQNVTAVISDTVVLATKRDIDELAQSLNNTASNLSNQISTVKPEAGSTPPNLVYTGKLWVNASDFLQYYDGSNWKNVKTFFADTVDGFHASLTPAPNVIVPLSANGVLDLSATYVKSNVYTFRRVDLTGATSDYLLQVGEEAYISFTSATSVPLHIATASNALYWLYCTCACYLLPNNTSYLNAFKTADWGANYDGTTVASVLNAYTNSGFALGNTTGTGSIISYLDISNAKTITQHIAVFSTTPYSIRHFASHWVSPASWTSLGTLSFAASTSGYVLVRRLA